MKRQIQLNLCVIGLWIAGFLCGRSYGHYQAMKASATKIEAMRVTLIQNGFHAGISATLRHIKINGTNKPAVDLADVLAEAPK